MYLDDLRKLKDDKEKSFLQSEIHLQAKKDFNYLCSQIGYSVFNNVDLLTVKTTDNKLKTLGNFLVLGHDMSKGKLLTFPQGMLDVDNENQFLAVVTYKDNAVVNAFAFKADCFKSTSMFGIFKDISKKGQYGVVIGDASNKKLQPYSFGLVLKNLEEN